MPGDIPDRFGIHLRNDAIGDERFPGSMVGHCFPAGFEGPPSLFLFQSTFSKTAC
jgi:hypothetical protein